MRYLRKPDASSLATGTLTYERVRDRTPIRETLIREQRGFCAYSERYFEPTDSAHIEHFDPRLKGQAGDNHVNWYAVHAFMNLNKPKAKSIEKFQPMVEHRRKHVRRIANILSMLDGDRNAWLGYLREHPVDLSFATALESELNIDVAALLPNP